MAQVLNLINGELVPAVSGKTLDNLEPATGLSMGSVPDSDGSDIDKAVTAARNAFFDWRHVPASARSRLLRNLADAIAMRAEDFAQIESKDTGKPIQTARRVDIPRAIANFEFFADSATQFASECHPVPGAIHYTLREPIGVVGAISPWNLPLYLLTWKIAPALASGNTVVAKPSELTPESAFLLSQLAIEVGIPKGVLNIVHGTGSSAGKALVENPSVKAISFTGSTDTGRVIAEASAPLFRKVSLEMGGKNASIVFDDCDPKTAALGVIQSAFSNQGQICLCGSRILIHRKIYASFRDLLVEKAHTLKIGDPLLDSTDQGSLISKHHLAKVKGYMDLAITEGGKILCGGREAKIEGRCAGGAFFEPTLIEGIPSDCRVNQEEIFGPVATLIPFEADRGAILGTNNSKYGLSASIWTKDATRLLRIAESLEVGMVWGNSWMVRDLRTPFGGAKASGLGREGGWEAMRFFTEPKNVCIQFG